MEQSAVVKTLTVLTHLEVLNALAKRDIPLTEQLVPVSSGFFSFTEEIKFYFWQYLS